MGPLESPQTKTTIDTNTETSILINGAVGTSKTNTIINTNTETIIAINEATGIPEGQYHYEGN